MTTPQQASQPPQWATKLLVWLCPDELLEEVQGDLQEIFEQQLTEAGEKMARREYILSVLGYLRPWAFNKKSNHPPNPLYTDMLKSHLTIAFRMLLRNRLRTAIHILGLSIGISTCLALYQIISFELSFDAQLPGRDRIYQVTMQVDDKDGKHINNFAPTPAALAIRQEVTGIETTAQFFMMDAKVKVEGGGKSKTFAKQGGIIFADTGYLELLPYTWLSGSAEKALSAPYQVVLTARKMQQYFGAISPDEAIGRELVYQDSLRMMVTGVVEELEGNTDFTFTDFLSIRTIEQPSFRGYFYFNDWNSITSSSRALVKLAKGSRKEEIDKQLAALSEKYFQKGDGFISHLQLQPFSEVHFTGAFMSMGPSLANKTALYGLSIISAFILLIACINFINLETAQAIYRAKEVGIRKTLGSRRQELIWQFLSETWLITSMAVLLSIVLSKALLKYFQELIPAGVALNGFSPVTLFFLLGITLVVGLLAGLYPALVLSAYSPVKALRNQLSAWRKQTRSAFVRKNLTVVQFTLSQIFLFGTLVIGQQIHHMLHADMGFDKEAIISFRMPELTTEEQRMLFKQRIQQVPGVGGVSLSNSTPASTSMWVKGIEFASPSGPVSHTVQQKIGDTNFLDLYAIPLVAGRNIRQTPDEVVINETYRKLLGFAQPEQALQQTLKVDDQKLTIVGITVDYYLRPVNEAILPAMYRYDFSRAYMLNVKLEGKHSYEGQVKEVLARLENVWKEQYSDEPFSYSFVDESVEAFYKKEENILKMLQVATGIAILVSCLGLLGLSSFTIAQRAKEIGIRKVLGASVSQIVALLLKDFVKLILISFVVAAPIAWLLLSKWLEDFTYRIELQGWMFAMAGSLALLAALLTVSFQSVKAALTNPVKSLRSE